MFPPCIWKSVFKINIPNFPDRNATCSSIYSGLVCRLNSTQPKIYIFVSKNLNAETNPSRLERTDPHCRGREGYSQNDLIVFYVFFFLYPSIIPTVCQPAVIITNTGILVMKGGGQRRLGKHFSIPSVTESRSWDRAHRPLFARRDIHRPGHGSRLYHTGVSKNYGEAQLK